MKKHKTLMLAAFLLCSTTITIVTPFPKHTDTLEPLEPVTLPSLQIIEPVATATIPILKKQVAAPELDPTLKKICSCESSGRPDQEPRQFNSDGTVVRGKINPLDVGMCQINLKYHQATAERLGYELFTEYGNASYATWLYKTQGTQPWSWSKSCWAQ